MAGKGISLDILANVRDALRGVGDVEKALADVESTLSDMDRAGDDSTDKMSRGFRDLARKADDSADTIEKKYKTTYRDIARAADDAADKTVKSQRRMGEKSAEVGQEIRQNLGEGIANAARGDFESLADSIGDTFGGAVAGIGGIATAGVAAAGALGIGALVASLSAAEEKITTTRERAIELAAIMQQNGGKIPLTDRVQELITLLGSERLAQNPFEQIGRDFVDLGTNIDAAKAAAVAADVPIYRLLRGLTGTDLKITQSTLTAVNDQLERMNEVALGDVDEAYDAQQRALKTVKTELEGVVAQQELAKELSESTEFINAKEIEERGARATAALADMEARLSGLSSLWQNAATDAAGYFSKSEEGATQFDWTTYLTDAEATMSAADEIKKRLVGLPDDIRAEAERIFAAQGAVSANEYTRAYEAASDADKGRFVSAASANGEAMGTAQADALKDAFGTPALPTTLDDSETRIRLQALRDKAAEALRVRIVPDTSAVDNYMSALQRRAAEGVTVKVNAGQGRVWE